MWLIICAFHHLKDLISFAFAKLFDKAPEKDVLTDEFKHQVKEIRKSRAPIVAEEIIKVGNHTDEILTIHRIY